MTIRMAFSRLFFATMGLLALASVACLADPPAAPPAAAPAPPAADPAPAPPPGPPPAPATRPAAPPAAGGAAAKAQQPEELLLDTSDGLELHAWYYPPLLEEDEKPTATVILLHDLEGSHRSVEPLAVALQAAGCGVVAPDLRGHGASTAKGGDSLDVRGLKKADFELMAATRGGQIREQSAIRGDVEAVRNWIRRKADEGEVDMRRLFVVGAGLGATVALAWTAEDASWPDGTKGPQGRQVRGVVLVSPAWTTRGFTINGPLANNVVKQEIPLMIVAGRSDRDSLKVFDQLKRQRPTDWFQQRSDKTTDKATKLEDPTKASLFFIELDSTRTADALAGDRTLNPGTVIEKFIRMALDRPRR
jgi:alpha-beta hydrolase superfamily lysophospholipase